MSQSEDDELMQAILGLQSVTAIREIEAALAVNPAPLSDGAKEQIKLRATFMNQLAVALFAVGGLAPILKASTDATLSTGVVGTVVVSSIVCFVLAGVLHFRAYEHLREMDQ